MQMDSRMQTLQKPNVGGTDDVNRLQKMHAGGAYLMQLH